VGHLHDIAAYDATVALVLDFARDHSDTLVVATSDHETGGLSLSRNLDGQPLYAWHPEVLNAASSSASAMAARLHGGDDPEKIFAEDAAIQDLTQAELDILKGDNSLFAEPRSSAATLAAVCDVINRRAGLSWTTTGHTAVDVPVFAYGPGASAFRGHQDNTDLCDRLAELFHFDLDKLTQKLRAGETPWWP
jgi:alkaline phosphatase